MERFAALPGSRSENAKQAIGHALERAAKERAYFADNKNVESFYATRKANEAGIKFCW